jgi:D-apionolactonase
MTALHHGRLAAEIRDGAVGAVTFDGVEVLRALTYPVRNADWGTHLTRTEAEEVGETTYVRRFADTGGAFAGEFRVALAGASVEVEVAFTFARATRVNRAGFTLLHPIRGVAGTALSIRHPDGRSSQTAFPARVSPAQPALDIAGMSHDVGGVRVEIAMEGEVFEMEDQRNWSDASYKTYCRPLSLPFPYAVAAGETIRQRIILTARAEGPVARPGGAAAPVAARMPQVMLAHEAGLSDLAALGGFEDVPVLFRLTPETPDADLHALAGRAGTALEIVFDDLPGLARLIARAAGLRPARVTSLPRGYLKSHQPEGPWPAGPAPGDAFAPLRAGFPGAAVGGGSLTNFTEFNRCRPDPATVDFVTFGNTAIVHAADDLSVWQTLEALPDIFATVGDIAAGKPLHLGLLSIGMRSNPYGASVAPNPERLRLPMAMEDPRQETGFAAAYAVAVLARAAAAGVESLALAMPGGPLGARGELAEVVRAAAALAGREVRVTEADGIVTIAAGEAVIAANCTGAEVPSPAPGLPPLAPESAAVRLPRKETR